MDTNNWRGVMLSEQVVPKVTTSTSTVWTVKSDGTIGGQFFRVIANYP
jgi:hypothetical protein